MRSTSSLAYIACVALIGNLFTAAFNQRIGISSRLYTTTTATRLHSSPLYVPGDIGDENDDQSSNKGEIEDAFGAPVGPLPSVSSRVNWAETIPNIVHDLWIVGCGTLGTIAAKEWMKQFPDSKVVAETSSETRHADLLKLGVKPRLRSQRTVEDNMSARYVLITLPPSSNLLDYTAELCDACQLWAGPYGQGHLAFTSSTVVYGDSNGNVVDEVFRVDSRSARSTKYAPTST
jgi:hypothetical protein